MIDVESIECTPTKILQEVADTLQARAIENNNLLKLEFVGPLPKTIVSDPKRFQQVLTNVIGNAIKFTFDGEVTATMKLSESGVIANTQQLKVEVVDTGIGMSEEQLKKIFDPFVQADLSVTRRFGGTGLGLSISRQLAESLGGGVTVTSQENVGSKFVIAIDAGAPNTLDLISEDEVWHLLKNKTNTEWVQVDLSDLEILIADDAETNRELLSCVLQDCGAKADIVENGEEAVQAAIKKPYHVVLMDMQMPILDGYSATKQLREAGFESPIIALTANTMKGDREKCIGVGCSDYLSKPIDMGTLLTMLADIAGVEANLCHTEAPAIHLGNEYDPSDWRLELPEKEPIRSFAISFIQKLENKFPDFESAFESRDDEALGELAHWAKGTSGTVKLNQISEKFHEMEEALRALDWESARSKYEIIKHRLRKAEASKSQFTIGL